MLKSVRLAFLLACIAIDRGSAHAQTGCRLLLGFTGTEALKEIELPKQSDMGQDLTWLEWKKPLTEYMNIPIVRYKTIPNLANNPAKGQPIDYYIDVEKANQGYTAEIFTHADKPPSFGFQTPHSFSGESMPARRNALAKHIAQFVAAWRNQHQPCNRVADRGPTANVGASPHRFDFLSTFTISRAVSLRISG